MEWRKVESMEKPSEYDFSSSKKFNYVRRNIQEVERENDFNRGEDQEEKTYTVYVYEEAKIAKDDWGVYQDLVQAQADIDYLTMLTEDL